jgi:hypothetical protein
MKLGPATARVRVAGLAGESIVYTRGGLAQVGPPARGARAPARPERDPRAGRARPAGDSHGSISEPACAYVYVFQNESLYCMYVGVLYIHIQKVHMCA